MACCAPLWAACPAARQGHPLRAALATDAHKPEAEPSNLAAGPPHPKPACVGGRPALQTVVAGRALWLEERPVMGPQAAWCQRCGHKAQGCGLDEDVVIGREGPEESQPLGRGPSGTAFLSNPSPPTQARPAAHCPTPSQLHVPPPPQPHSPSQVPWVQGPSSSTPPPRPW